MIHTHRKVLKAVALKKENIAILASKMAPAAKLQHNPCFSDIMKTFLSCTSFFEKCINIQTKVTEGRIRHKNAVRMHISKEKRYVTAKVAPSLGKCQRLLHK